MPETIHAPHVVLGAGAMGSAACYHLALRGEPVLLIDRFRLGHDRGSSHGASRIIRHSYADARYARLMPEAFRCWRVLEAAAGRPLLVRTGGVSFAPTRVDEVAKVAANLDELGVPFRRMSGAEWSRRHPAFSLPADDDVVFEPDAGMLAAEAALASQVAVAREVGGDRTTVLEATPITRIDLESDRPSLEGEGLRIVAGRLIVAAGAWTSRLLSGLGVALRVTRQQVVYLHPPEPVATFGIGRLPIFIGLGADRDRTFYGMPPLLGRGIKVARHGGPEVDPDEVSREVDDEYRLLIRSWLRDHLPALAVAPIEREEVCLYTEAPGDDFVVGPLPGRPEVIVASPCSGHGFKFSCLIGRVLADLAVSGQTDVDVAGWSPPGRAEWV